MGEKQNLFTKFDLLDKCSKREAALKRGIAQTSCVENENKNRRKNRNGKDKNVELKAQKLGKTDFRATNGWLTRWLHRENIVHRKLHGEQAEADTKR